MFRFLDQRKQAKMQCVQDHSQSFVDSVNNVGREGSRHSRNKRKEYMRAMFKDLQTNSEVKKYW